MANSRWLIGDGRGSKGDGEGAKGYSNDTDRAPEGLNGSEGRTNATADDTDEKLRR